MRCCWIGIGPLTEFSRHIVRNGVKGFVIKFSQRDTDQCTHMNAISRVCVCVSVCAHSAYVRERREEREREGGGVVVQTMGSLQRCGTACQSPVKHTSAKAHRQMAERTTYCTPSFHSGSLPSLPPPPSPSLSSSPLFRSLQRCHHSACF